MAMGSFKLDHLSQAIFSQEETVLSGGERTAESAFVLLDDRGAILYCNPAWERLVGRLTLAADACEVGASYIERCLDIWKHQAHDMQGHVEDIGLLLAGTSEQRNFAYSLRIDGTTRWFMARAIPFAGMLGSRVLVLHEEITTSVAREAALSRRAFFDDLTRLPNFAHFNQRLRYEIEQSKRSGDPLAVIFLDLDNFKAINDRFGHLAGNQALEAIAQRIQACVRACDTVSRFGGDEFAVLLPGMGHQFQARALAGKIKEAVSEPLLVDGMTMLSINASVGIGFYPNQAETPEALIDIADREMYRGKLGHGSAQLG